MTISDEELTVIQSALGDAAAYRSDLATSCVRCRIDGGSCEECQRNTDQQDAYELLAEHLDQRADAELPRHVTTVAANDGRL